MTLQGIMLGLAGFLHNVFTVVWLGGVIMIALTLLPAARQAFGNGPQLRTLMSAVLQRQRVWVYISIAGLFVTGLIQAGADAAFEGLFRFTSTYAALISVKHLLTFAMVAIALFRSLVLSKKGETATPAQSKQSLKLIYINAILGVLILLLSGFMAVL